MASLYLHIPFCLAKCHYCSFSSYAAANLYGPYLLALKEEISLIARANSNIKLDTLFVGGGTPTCMPSADLCNLLQHCFTLFDIDFGVEISVEANPGTIDGAYLEALLAVGVNRLSIGVQSFNDRELKTLGRIHDAKAACLAIDHARGAGFKNISMDLMYGLPGQTPASWENSLQVGLSFSPEHLSLYQLTLEPHSSFYDLPMVKILTLSIEEELLQMDSIAKQLCNSRGLRQYEISSFSKKDFYCRHNINYWHNNDYWAAGASAVSYIRGVREKRIADPDKYIRLVERNDSVVIARECLDKEDSFRETVIMGLRMVQGVSRIVLYKRYGIDLIDYYGQTLEKLLALDLLAITKTHLRITANGWSLSNRIMAELV